MSEESTANAWKKSKIINYKKETNTKYLALNTTIKKIPNPVKAPYTNGV